MLKILFIDHTPFWGGAEKVLGTHIESLDESKFCPLVAISKEHPEFKEEFEKAGARVFLIPFGRLKIFSLLIGVGFYKTVLSIVKIIRAEEVNLIVSNTSRACYTATLAALFCRTPIIFWVHDFFYIKPLFRLILPLASGVIWSSHAVRNFYKVGETKKSCVIYAENRFSERLKKVKAEDLERLRKKWGALESAAVVGFVGRLVEEKGVGFLIQAAKILKSKTSFDFRIIIVGSGKGQKGSNEEELKAMVKKLNLRKEVKFIGFVENPASVYKAFDIFVSPSAQFESHPTVVVEAMLAGLPVVATSVGGISEIIEDGENGFLIPPKNSLVLAEVLIKLAKDLELRKKIGNKAHKAALLKFGQTGTTRKFEEFYRQILRG